MSCLDQCYKYWRFLTDIVIYHELNSSTIISPSIAAILWRFFCVFFWKIASQYVNITVRKGFLFVYLVGRRARLFVYPVRLFQTKFYWKMKTKFTLRNKYQPMASEIGELGSVLFDRCNLSFVSLWFNYCIRPYGSWEAK